MLDKKEFIGFLMDSGVLTFGDFVTKSGRKSPYFINTGNFKTGDQLSSLGKFYSQCIMDNINKGKIAKEVNVLFGPAYKGIPLTTATAISLAKNHDKNIVYCFNRKEAKDHGEGGSIIGYSPKDGDKVLLIEDVITAGTAVRETVPLLKSIADVEICGLVIAVDRMEKGREQISAIQEIYDEYGITTFPIVNVKEILEVLISGGVGDNEENLAHVVAPLEEYMSKYCVQ
jgi:orotate phosphoribosyltransferase